jgi:uncharacterized protein
MPLLKAAKREHWLDVPRPLEPEPAACGCCAWLRSLFGAREQAQIVGVCVRLNKKENQMANENRTRGFASMDGDKQREIARKGGQSVPAEERSFSKDHELASEAGRKGGRSVPAEERSFSKDRELASEAGRKGGHASGGNFANDHGRASEAGRKGGQN